MALTPSSAVRSDLVRSDLVRSDPVQPGATQARLRDLLNDLGGSLRRGDGLDEGAAPARWPTGLSEIDRLLGGGFPRGRLSEIAGPASGGRTSLGLALLARTTAAGEVVAVVDVADAFDPGSAQAAGVDLERVLWVRAPGLREALRSTEHLLTARGFSLVLLDLACAAAQPRTRSGRGRAAGGVERAPAVWPRLRKASAAAGAALVVLGDERSVGACADLALETGPCRPRFTGTPALLEGLESELRVVRNRLGPHVTCVPVRWPQRKRIVA